MDPFGLERFFGEDRANEFLRRYGCDTKRAWQALQGLRQTYPGLREDDRNGEHYLYARWKVEQNSYEWGVYHVLNVGYETLKFYDNVTFPRSSSYRQSPATSDEFFAGFYGANDGLWGSPNPCNGCKK
jgi:hypothetical protein